MVRTLNTTRVALAMAAAVVVFGQAPDPKLTFEVASIKPSPPFNSGQPVRIGGNGGGPGSASPERITYGRISVRNLITLAFGITNVQVVGPSWFDSPSSDVWDIQAKVPEGASKDDVKVMLQNLLVDRFGLIAHRETREMQAYELIIAKNGPKLKESEAAANPAPPPQPGDPPQ